MQIVKTAVPKILDDVGHTAVNSTISNVMGAVQGDNGMVTGEEDVVYVDEQGNVIGQGFCGGAIYAKGIPYGGAIYARGIYVGGDPVDDPGAITFEDLDDDENSSPASPIMPDVNTWKMVPKRRQRSASDAARPYRANPSPVVVTTGKQRRKWNWPSMPRFSIP